MAQAYTAEQFERDVLKYYLAHSKACTIAELASYTGRSAATLRKTVQHLCGGRVDMTEEFVAAHSKSYPGIQVGGRMAMAFMPSRNFLVEMFHVRGGIIDSLRKTIELLKADAAAGKPLYTYTRT